MPLTPQERQRRRQTDPYFGLAEELSQQPSLAQQKGMANATASVEKKRELDPAQAAADEALQADGTDLADIAESSLRQGWEQLSDFFTGAPERSNEEIAKQADIKSGVTEEGRQRLVGAPQEAVVQSLAKGNYFDAALDAAKAGPGTLADSANVIPELAVGALATSLGGRALAGRRVKKGKEGIGRIFDRVDVARENLAKNAADASKNIAVDALKGVPKAAGQVSLATADITQRQNNDFRELHGRDMDRTELATAYGINLATMLPTPAIIKNLFIPSFKKQMTTEIKTLVKNIKGGSNFKQIMSRVVDGTKKVVAAGGAEAGQEYFQTWAEAINVQMGPKERTTFWKSIQEVIGDEDNQMQALVGAYLGGGAGGTARAVVSVPAVAAGATVDTAKGTAKVAGKTALAVGKGVSNVAKAVVNNAAYKVLSQEERDIIASEAGSRKKLVDIKVKEFEGAAEKVKAAKSLDELRENELYRKVISDTQQERGLTDDQMGDRKVLESIKGKLIRAYRGDIGLLKTELAAQFGQAVAARSAKNIGDATSNAATAAVRAVSPGAKAVIAEVQQYGEQAVKAVKELRSSTALGMIELAANAGKEQTSQILEAARTLSLDDLERTTAVISEFNTDLARKLQNEMGKKEKALERAGIKSKVIVNSENLSPAIKALAGETRLKVGQGASVSSIINQTLAGKIDDVESLDQVFKAVALLESSADFKNQENGAMSRDNMVVVKRKLERTRARLNRDLSAGGIVDKAAKVVGETAGKVAKAAKDAKDSDIVKDTTDNVRTKVEDVRTKIEDSAKKRAAGNVKISPGFKAVIEAVAEGLKKPDQSDALIKSAPDFVKQMNRYGVNNRAEFELFVEQFPEMQENIEFYKAVEEYFPSNIVADEVVDVFANLLLDTSDKIKEAYKKMQPECPV